VATAGSDENQRADVKKPVFAPAARKKTPRTATVFVSPTANTGFNGEISRRPGPGCASEERHKESSRTEMVREKYAARKHLLWIGIVRKTSYSVNAKKNSHVSFILALMCLR
jgi:hypothetical protein